MHLLRIGVVGKDGKIDRDIVQTAEMIGRDIARRDCVLICGGKGGVMEAVCRGVKSENGITVGILPSLDKNDANPYVDITITTGMGYARNAIVVSCSDVIIVINGGIGTLSEVALALNYGKPVVAVKGSGGVADRIEEELIKMGITQEIHITDPKNAVSLALSLVR